MEKELTKKIEEAKEKAKAKIVANSKDAAYAKKLINALVSLQKQSDVEAVELVVPTAEVIEERNLGALRLVKTHSGFLFEVKGGMFTFVHLRLTGVYDALSALFDLLEKEDTTEDENAFISAFMYVLQAPLMCSLNQGILYSVGAELLKQFNIFSQELLETPLQPETTEEVKKNIEFENANDFAEQLTKSEIPSVE